MDECTYIILYASVNLLCACMYMVKIQFCTLKTFAPENIWVAKNWHGQNVWNYSSQGSDRWDLSILLDVLTQARIIISNEKLQKFWPYSFVFWNFKHCSSSKLSLARHAVLFVLCHAKARVLRVYGSRMINLYGSNACNKRPLAPINCITVQWWLCHYILGSKGWVLKTKCYSQIANYPINLFTMLF